MAQLLETTNSIALSGRGSGRLVDELDRATVQFLSELELQAQTIAPQTFHFYITVKHSTKGEHGFYLDTVSDRFTDVMNAINARRQDLGLFGYRFVESIDLGTLPF